MASRSNAGRAFWSLIVLGGASLVLLGGLLWWQLPHMAQGVWLACKSAAQALEGYLPLAGLLLPVALLLAGGLRGLSMAAAQLWSTHRLLSDLGGRRLPLPAELAALAGALQVDDRVTLVDDPAAYAFAAGLARPGIWLSTGLLVLLDETELAAVLRHERHHLRRRDPLRVLLARSLAYGLFFVPLAATLRDYYLEAKEGEADAATGTTHELAAALIKLLRAGADQQTRASLAALGTTPSTTSGRIRRLLEGDAAGRGLDRAVAKRFVASLALALALLAATALSQTQAASPLTGDECGYTTWPAAAESTSTPANFTPRNAAPGR